MGKVLSTRRVASGHTRSLTCSNSDKVVIKPLWWEVLLISPIHYLEDVVEVYCFVPCSFKYLRQYKRISRKLFFTERIFCIVNVPFVSPMASNLRALGGSTISMVRPNRFRHSGDFLAACTDFSAPSKYIRQQREEAVALVV